MATELAGPTPLKVLVNAVSIKEGGSRVVVLRLLAALVVVRSDIEWHLVLGSPVGDFASLTSDRIQIHYFPWVERSPIHLRFWYEWTLPRLVRKLHADLLFSLTNYLPDRRVRVPTLLLVQHAGHFSAEFRRLVLQHSDHWLSRLAWLAKTQWVRRSVSSATRVTVQTAALAHEIAVETGRALSTIDVVPHGLGLTRLGSAHAVREQGPWRIGYITKYGVQKNFYVLFQAMAILRGSGREMKLVLTLDPGTREFPELRAAMERAGIADQVENHGEIAQDRIEALYDSLDLFVFPSICESFGFPMVEAMARGLPLIASDTPGNREVAGTAGIFFRSDDSAVLAEKIVALCDEPERYRRFTALSIRRAADFSWEQAAVGVSRSIELALAAGG